MEKLHLIFDLDGTLVDSMPIGMEFCRQEISKIEGKEISKADFKEKVSSRYHEIFSAFGIFDRKIQQELFDGWVDLDKKYLKETKLFQDMREVLENLLKMGHRLYIWTARAKKTTDDILSYLEIGSLFSGIVTGDEGERKPSPDGIFRLLEGKEKALSSIVIGDSVNDYLGAQKANILFVAVTWCEFSSSKVFQDLGVENIAKTPKDILTIIQKLTEK